MTLEQLRIFVAVAERQHLTQAATALRLTPSAVSAALRVLEERYAVQLFHRVGRRIELSDAGRLFLVEAKAALASARAAEVALLEIGGLARGSLRLAASQTIASYWLPARMMRFKTRHPGVDLQLRECNTRGVADAVLAGDADLGFIEGVIDEPALASRQVAIDRLVIIAASAHPLHRRAVVRLEDLADAAWIFRELGSGTRSVFESMLKAFGLAAETLDVALCLPTNEAICSAVQSGPFVAAVSERVAEPHVVAGRLAAIRFELPSRPFVMLRHKERYRTKAAGAFETMLDAM